MPPSDLTPTRVHAWNVSVQRQVGDNMAVSASYIGNYTTNLWDVVTGNPGIIPAGVSPTGPCTLNTETGPQTFPNCSAAPLDIRRELTQQNPAIGRFIGFLDYFTDHGHAEIQRPPAVGSAPRSNGLTSARTTRCRNAMGHPSRGGGTATPASGYMTARVAAESAGRCGGAARPRLRPCDTDRRHIFTMSATVQSPEFDSTRRAAARIRLASVGQFPRVVRQAADRSRQAWIGR